MTETIVRGFLGVIPYLFVMLGLLVVFRLVHDRLTAFDDRYELKRGNAAAGLNRGAMYFGATIAMCGPLLGGDRAYGSDLLQFALEGVLALAIFTLASFVLDKVMLPKINNQAEIGRGNMAIAVVEAAAYIGLGFVMFCSLAGGGAPSFWRDQLSGVLFGVLGLATLVAIYMTFGVGYRIFKRCSVNDELARGNVAMAIEAGAVLLAMSLVLGFSIIGDFTGWANDIASYVIAAAAGVSAVAIAQLFTWLLFARGMTLRADGTHAANVASAAIRGGILLGLGLVAGLVTFV